MPLVEPGGASDEDRWGTLGCLPVLMVARTLTSTIRLLDVFELLRGDFRLAFDFTVDERSEFRHGSRTLLRRAGADRIVPWSSLDAGASYRLAIAASEQVDLHRIGCTTVVLPHGLGFNKFVPDAAGSGVRLAGLPPAAALRTGRVRLVLSHPEQYEQLRATNPEVAGQAVVTGDPTYDRLLAGRPLRDRYRRSVGADGRTVILLSSTWGPGSLLGQSRGLPARLLAELPSDEYRVCLALHPNIWSRYGRVVIRTWLADCLDAGLVLLPPSRGWQAALLAADVVVGDHGSVTMHAAGLRVPLLLAAFGPEVVPGTPVAALGRLAPRLDPAAPLRTQLDTAIANHDPYRLDEVVERVFAHVGDATRRVRDLLYAELGLPAPTTPPILPRPPFALPHPQSVRAFDVYTTYTEPATVSLLRFPRAVRWSDMDLPVPPQPWSVNDHHLVVDEDATDLRLAQMAAVMTRRAPAPDRDAVAWTETALHHHPGARLAVAATDRGCVVASRSGEQLDAIADQVDPMVVASAIYASLRTGVLRDGELTVWTGPSRHPVAIRRRR